MTMMTMMTATTAMMKMMCKKTKKRPKFDYSFNTIQHFFYNFWHMSSVDIHRKLSCRRDTARTFEYFALSHSSVSK